MVYQYETIDYRSPRRLLTPAVTFGCGRRIMPWGLRGLTTGLSGPSTTRKLPVPGIAGLFLADLRTPDLFATPAGGALIVRSGVGVLLWLGPGVGIVGANSSEEVDGVRLCFADGYGALSG